MDARYGANPRGRPDFLKILSPESLIMLAIPRRFVKHLNKRALKTTATLFSQNGEFWHIQVVLNPDDELDMQFGRGWELFVRAHYLKPGNSVLFTYEGNTVFSVKIFRSDGCCALCHCGELDVAPGRLVQNLEVKSESFEQPTNIANKKRKKVSDQKRVRNKGEQLFRFEWILRSYNVDLGRAQIYLPQGLVSATKSEMIFLDCLGRLWPVRLWVGLNEKFAITTGWKQLVRDTKLQKGDKCIFEPISQGVLGLKIERKS
ncbi:putative B3 domain-containing protein Os04g0347400 [Curcuma longa]|uniref:putative B3 domain-containing protein Os04g0347400 n=1 Tax=Curcuma longa TaxID=136217 RepID=UPI003D9DD7A5